MKVVGLITEYNPFHNGHRFHIEEAKRRTGAEYVIVIMSGNFVQRGAPALMDKYSRTKMALTNGADVVFELPVCFSTASAEYFAFGAVALLHKLGIVDALCFGSECGDITPLKNAAGILIDEPAEFKYILNNRIKEGVTFPTARMEALKAVLDSDNDTLLSSPNNILGIEYIKALLKLKSSMDPVTITRITASYHSPELTEDEKPTISSATAIRKSLLEDKTLSSLTNHIPDSVLKIMEENFQKSFPIFEDDFSLLLNYKLMLETDKSMLRYLDMTKDLANRIKQLDTFGLSYNRLAQVLKTKQWTLTRINRVLLHILLNLYSENMKAYLKKDGALYARILGFKKDSSWIIREISKHGQIPLLTKLAHAPKQLDALAMTMLNEDIFAAELYNLVVLQKYGYKIKNEFSHGVMMI